MSTAVLQPFLGSVSIFIGCGTIVLGLLVYSKEPQHRLTQAFLFFALAIGVWDIITGMFAGATDHAVAEFMILFLFLTSLLAPYALFYFVLTLAVSDPGRKRMYASIAAIPYILLALSAFIPGWHFNGVLPHEGLGWTIVFGKGVLLYAGTQSIIIGIIIYLFVREYIRRAGIFRARIRWIFITIMFVLVVVFSTNFVFYLLGIPDYFWVGPIALFIGMLLTSYMFIRLRLWNIKLIGTEFFTAMVVLALVFDTIYADLYFEFVLKFTITVLVLLASIFLIRSVRREIAAKEEVKHLLDDLSDAHRKLQIIDRNKSEFIESASRNLRDPLLAIQGYASLLREDMGASFTTEGKNVLKKIYESTQRFLKIIDEFMNVSLIETEKIQYQYEAFNIRELLDDIVEEMNIAAEKKELSLTVRDKRDDDHTLTADPGKLRQVFSNLIDNAIKYTQEGSITVTIDTDTKNTGIEGIHVSVRDTGIGMEDKTLRKIFKKFSRAENVAKLSTEGSGLGLYVARRIVEDHGGNIWAESEGKGQGSTFHVVVPWEAHTSSDNGNGT